MQKSRKRRRIERRKMELVASAVAQGRPLEDALAQQRVSRANFEAWSRVKAEVAWDNGDERPFTGPAVIAGGLLFAVGAYFESGVVSGLGWCAIFTALLIRTVDYFLRGVDRNWNTGHLTRWDDSPIAFLLGMVIHLLFDLGFLWLGVMLIVRGFSGAEP